jgi:hypothetical protein
MFRAGSLEIFAATYADVVFFLNAPLFRYSSSISFSNVGLCFCFVRVLRLGMVRAAGGDPSRCLAIAFTVATALSSFFLRLLVISNQLAIACSKQSCNN